MPTMLIYSIHWVTIILIIIPILQIKKLGFKLINMPKITLNKWQNQD